MCLGMYDHTRGIMVHRTFVSMDMLKEKQLSAWQKVESITKKSLEIRNKYGLKVKSMRNGCVFLHKNWKFLEMKPPRYMLLISRRMMNNFCIYEST